MATRIIFRPTLSRNAARQVGNLCRSADTQPACLRHAARLVVLNVVLSRSSGDPILSGRAGLGWSGGAQRRSAGRRRRPGRGISWMGPGAQGDPTTRRGAVIASVVAIVASSSLSRRCLPSSCAPLRFSPKRDSPLFAPAAPGPTHFRRSAFGFGALPNGVLGSAGAPFGLRRGRRRPAGPFG